MIKMSQGQQSGSQKLEEIWPNADGLEPCCILRGWFSLGILDWVGWGGGGDGDGRLQK